MANHDMKCGKSRPRIRPFGRFEHAELFELWECRTCGYWCPCKCTKRWHQENAGNHTVSGIIRTWRTAV